MWRILVWWASTIEGGFDDRQVAGIEFREAGYDIKQPKCRLNRTEENREMIIRSWRAVAGAEEVLDAYAYHLKTTTFVEMAELP